MGPTRSGTEKLVGLFVRAVTAWRRRSWALLGAMALGTGQLGRGPTQRGGQVLGAHFDLGPALAGFGLPAALVQAPGDEHPVALGQGSGGVLGQGAPGHHVYERSRPKPRAIQTLKSSRTRLSKMISLLVSAQGTHNAPRWSLAMALGLRQGEVLGLCWDDVELPPQFGSEGAIVIRRQLQRVSWQHGCSDPANCHSRSSRPAKRGADCPRRGSGGLKVSTPKSSAGRRTLTIPATLTAELRTHRKAQAAARLPSEIWQQGPNGGWVFATKSGDPVDPRADNRAFKGLSRRAKVPIKRLHDLRHSAATMMLDSDLDLKTVGQLLEHSQVAHPAKYSHILADRKSVAVTRIDQTLFGPRRQRPKR
jgi:hypothetical protein